MFRRLFPGACFAVAVLLTSGAFASGALAADRPPNLILILADDLGYGDLGCYGQQRIKTPHLDQLAAEGLRFTQFYAGSTVCAPSRCALMMGQHTGHCLIRGNSRQDLRPDDVTLARVLKSAGYATALCGKWGLGTEGGTGVPTRQGFDFFYGYLDQHHAHNYYPAYLFKNEERVPLRNVVPGNGPFGSNVATKKVEYSHDLVMQQALDFIDREKERPFLLYLAVTIPHANNEAGNQGMEVPELGAYADLDWPAPQKGHAAMIDRMDRDVGRLMARLRQHNIDEHTLVMFSSDNGPHAEGGNNPNFNDSNGPLRGIKRDLYDGGIRVPTMVRWPGKVPAGKTSDFIGAHWDVYPTFAELAGAADRAPAGLDGISFVPTLLGTPEKQRPRDYLYWAFYERGGSQAVRSGRWKAVEQPYGSPVQLYDVEKDIGESTDVAADHPQVVATMKKYMAEAYAPSDVWKFKPPADAGKKKAAE
jgi:arylsulfatase A-like enzyme